MSVDGTRPVVVGANGDATDTAALQWAAQHAGECGRPLVVVHASEPEALAARAAGAGAPDITVLLEAEEARGQTVHEAVAQLAAEHQIDTSVAIERGSPVRQLLERQDEAALLVVGTGRKGALEEFVLGTTSISVVAHASIPVVVVNPAVEVSALRHGVVGVAVDGSPDSAAAARAALAYAAETGRRVLALTAWYLEVVDGYVVTEPDSPEWATIEAERLAMLTEALAPARADFPDVEVELSVRRGPIVGILRALSAELDLLVVGSRGRGAFSGRLLGSVSQKVMRNATCPVLVATAPRR